MLGRVWWTTLSIANSRVAHLFILHWRKRWSGCCCGSQQYMAACIKCDEDAQDNKDYVLHLFMCSVTAALTLIIRVQIRLAPCESWIFSDLHAKYLSG